MTSVWSICASIGLGVLLLGGCASNESYDTLDSGSKWRLRSFGDMTASVDSSSIVFLDVLTLDYGSGDTLSAVENMRFETGKDELWSVLRNRFEGDSIEYISTQRDFLHPGTLRYDTLQYFIKIDQMRTQREVEDSRLIELQLLSSISKTDSVYEYYEEYDGVFMRQITATLNTPVEEGKEIVIHYKGYDLNGKVFDDTRLRNQPLRFVMGNEDQVLSGIEIALYQMRKGEKARIILPSWLAFKAKGSGAGIVKPHSVVIYELEVVDVAK